MLATVRKKNVMNFLLEITYATNYSLLTFYTNRAKAAPQNEYYSHSATHEK